MRRASRLLLVSVCLTAACAHAPPPAPAGPSRSVAEEAARISRIAYEDDFQEARLVYQALPPGAGERAALREKLLHYLLDPVLVLRPDELRREVRDIESDDIYDRIFESFRDAVDLYEPSELWATPARVSPAEQAL